jgi:hypothetical protein
MQLPAARRPGRVLQSAPSIAVGRDTRAKLDRNA